MHINHVRSLVRFCCERCLNGGRSRAVLATCSMYLFARQHEKWISFQMNGRKRELHFFQNSHICIFTSVRCMLSKLCAILCVCVCAFRNGSKRSKSWNFHKALDGWWKLYKSCKTKAIHFHIYEVESVESWANVRSYAPTSSMSIIIYGYFDVREFHRSDDQFPLCWRLMDFVRRTVFDVGGQWPLAFEKRAASIIFPLL